MACNNANILDFEKCDYLGAFRVQKWLSEPKMNMKTKANSCKMRFSKKVFNRQSEYTFEGHSIYGHLEARQIPLPSACRNRRSDCLRSILIWY